MRALIQRVSRAEVNIYGASKGSIGKGLLILLGIGHDDGQEDIDWLCKKIVQLRIFSDADGKMNLDLKDVDGDAMVVSQFTLHAKTKKGNRPSYVRAAGPDVATPLYEQFKSSLAESLGKVVESGEFGADMQVSLVNDGPVTIWLDTKQKD